MKFKMGDKVKILPSATGVGVDETDVGKGGVISSVSMSGSSALVYMDGVCSGRGLKCRWSVNTNMIKLLPTKGQQLLFSFMDK